MADRRPPADEAPEPASNVPDPDSGYTDDEEAEVRRRLEDLGYVE